MLTHRDPAATVTGVRLTRRRMHLDAGSNWRDLSLQPRPVANAVAWFREVRWLP